jgi:hypothetical protein
MGCGAEQNFLLKDRGALTLMRLELKDNIAPLLVAEIKNAWSYTAQKCLHGVSLNLTEREDYQCIPCLFSIRSESVW